MFAADVGGESAKVRVDLSEEEFRLACDAMREGKGVSVSGIIRNDVRTREYELHEPMNLIISECP